MAWTDQCQIAFRANADILIKKKGGKGTIKTIKNLSKESWVPFETLKRWYYVNQKEVESVVKNDNGYETNGDNNINETDSNNNICPICEIRKRERFSEKENVVPQDHVFRKRKGLRPWQFLRNTRRSFI